MTSDVIVIGGGVIGLTTAVVLAESGLRTGVWSRDPAADTTSAVAGGLWWPYRIEPLERVGRWSLETLRELTALAAPDPLGAAGAAGPGDEPDGPGPTGVRLAEGTMCGTGLADVAAWAAEVPGLRTAAPHELPDGVGRGLRARVPLVDMPAYLAYLRRRLEAAGGTVEARTATSLAEAAGHAPTVVNCAGLGARELVPDPAVRPVQGQLVIVANPGVTTWTVAADDASSDTTYLLPQPYGLVLGGTAREDAWDTEPDPATAEAIIARCARFHPEVAGAEVLRHRVGLRPARAEVRLAVEELPDGARVVHNYGHGGAGVTVSWGCAREAARLADRTG
ncbi:FAD-binding oxidoreductase [Streptomyces pactum]|uniref:D-amino-acid oxidase n=1 Tax=Streptomyces pactum TaxID=68249 RepID=A0ABS0NRJ2_9ACTN|nr:FAD-dependent oxidoreductase [Streptomyces pactum]MBH5337806.1 FAD-binding oxidoreductase [Streptomyces pactum]